ncbi:MAG TPA: FAD-dependent oxidoreductase, partial [Burkholderiales bacterium]|nr:FAD-dependent oxidoreductase [Burkholderiales bacterium]
MTDLSPVSAAVGRLRPTFAGRLLQRNDAGYNEARRVHNGLIDKRPALIAQCRGLADIVDAIQFARTQKLEVAVRGGGHNVAGRATIDGGVVIDMSLMKGIHVDPKARTARAQGGLTWKDFNRETQLHGLATTGGVVSTTGIAGLTLGGGLGWLMGKHALALDNLISVDVVLADGRMLTASKEDNADLFWALRGGGGNFGVVTSFLFKLHPIPNLYAGPMLWSLDRSAEVLRWYRDFITSAPDELNGFFAFLTVPAVAPFP